MVPVETGLAKRPQRPPDSRLAERFRPMPTWFDDEVRDLEQRTSPQRNMPNPIVFYGSSSFRLWHDMAAYFPGYNVVNHGFGGSTLADCNEYFDRLVAAVEPQAIVLYAGDNDLGDGSSPEQVLERLRWFVTRKRETLGDTPMAYVSIKISPARFAIMHGIAYTNRLIERALAAERDVRFVDVTRRMVGRGMMPLLGCYTDDPLHMNREGYRILGRSLADYLGEIESAAGDLRSTSDAERPAWMLVDDDDAPEDDHGDQPPPRARANRPS